MHLPASAPRLYPDLIWQPGKCPFFLHLRFLLNVPPTPLQAFLFFIISVQFWLCSPWSSFSEYFFRVELSTLDYNCFHASFSFTLDSPPLPKVNSHVFFSASIRIIESIREIYLFMVAIFEDKGYEGILFESCCFSECSLMFCIYVTNVSWFYR